MFKLSGFLASVFVGCLSSHLLVAQCTEAYLVGNTATPTGTDIGQSFTMSLCGNGNFTQIGIVTLTNNSDVTLRIYEGDGYSGTLKYTQTGISWSVSNPNTFFVNLSGGTGSLNYVNGQTYTFRFTVGGGTFQLLHHETGMYNGGQMYIGTTAQPSKDLNFEVVTDVPLPVELSAFEASVVPEGVKLHWATASESENAGFQVERSQDGMNWTELAFIPGNGTTTEEQHYQWLDNRPAPGANYYRLRQVDYDGSFQFSSTRMVRITTPQFISMYPNPVSSGDLLYIEVPDAVEQAELLFFSLDGKLLRTEKTKGGDRLELTMDLPPGVYALRSRQRADVIHRLVVSR
ncbi:MAG: hypothetical protein KatS3mg029_0305 [Saprospiraceae bacterium]|nr:MAG: hypothetical protein KatS3mg029_0297 [Saprospiraceae bacterium]GIV30954.1 MAG: hypothetical protein KatS3mg029_0305 [Saprospiraceae bacterium]